MKELLFIIALPVVGVVGVAGGLFLAAVLIGTALDTPHNPD